MRYDDPEWPSDVRCSNDDFEDAVALRDYHKEMKKRCLFDAEEAAYLDKERAAARAVRRVPLMYEVRRDGRYEGMLLIRSRLSGKALHFPIRKEWMLSLAA